MKASASINRFLLPGLAFKATVIGGGYATGRELVEFFLPAGPVGGLLGILAAMLIWSLVCALTFVLAFRWRALDYSAFFRRLLGPAHPAFEILYFVNLILVLSVFGSAAGAIGHALFGIPDIAGTLALVGSVLAVTAAGEGAAEAVFKYVSVLLYGVYAIFLVDAVIVFAPAIGHGFRAPVPTTGWLTGGITYASYNVIGAVLILPVLRHLRCERDAWISGLLSGPLAMIPAIVFFTCLVAFYPTIAAERLPSDVVLTALGQPAFRYAFEIMVFFALLECSVGFLQAFMMRLDDYNRHRGRRTTAAMRLFASLAIVLVSIVFASGAGLVQLIAQGYRLMAYGVMAVFLAPVLTYGLYRVVTRTAGPRADTPA